MFCQSASFAQYDEYGRWKTELYYVPVELNYRSYSKEDFTNALIKIEAGKAELKLQINEWAGNYSASSGEVDQKLLRWTPNNGFVYLGFYTCTPEVRSLKYGDVIATNDYIKLKSHNSKEKEKAVKYLFVKWGERHYLVPDNEVAAFYKFVAGYGWRDDEYVFFDFLLRNGDYEKPITGMPIFPRGYERFVKKPIEASVIKIISRKIKTEKDYDGELIYSSQTFLKLNVGSRQGVKSGMVFNITDSEDYEKVKILKVAPTSSTAVLVRSLDENKQETFKDWQNDKIKQYPQITIGLELSTSSNLAINNGTN